MPNRLAPALAGFVLLACGDSSGDSSAPDTGGHPTADDEVLYGDLAVTLVDGNEDGVITLASAIRMSSGVTLDCGGLVLRPAVPIRGPLREAASDPEVAVFVANADGASVRSCGIEGFEFGIFAAGGGTHRFEDNAIESRNAPITLIDSDDNRVEDNTIRFGSTGVVITRRADRNVVRGNELVHTLVAYVHRGMPGAEAATGYKGEGVLIFDAPVDVDAVINVKVGSELLQYPSAPDNVDDNLIEGNTITLLESSRGLVSGLYIAVRSRRTVARDNVIVGGGESVHLPGFPDDFPLYLPGRCAGDPDRHCRGDDDVDCAFPGIDEEPLGPCLFEDDEGNAAGTCDGGIACATSDDCAEGPCLRSMPFDRQRVQQPTVEDNRLEGALDIGVAAAFTNGAVVRGNVITGARIGIASTHYSLERDSFTRNTVTGSEVGIRLAREIPVEVGVVVTENDFIDTDLGIESHFLSLRLDGNYWDHDACPGFSTDDAEGDVVDCAPYAVSVANGVPEGTTRCPVETRPRAFDAICALEAPATLAVSGDDPLSFEVTPDYTGEYRVRSFGLAAAEIEEGQLAQGEQPRYPVDVPAGARHLRVRLAGAGDEDRYLYLVVFDGSCEIGDMANCAVIAERLTGAADETIDLEAPLDDRYVIAIEPRYVPTDVTTYAVSWWVVGGGPATFSAEPSASMVTPGTPVTVTVDLPDVLEAGSLGLIEHANEHTTLGTTLLEVVAEP